MIGAIMDPAVILQFDQLSLQGSLNKSIVPPSSLPFFHRLPHTGSHMATCSSTTSSVQGPLSACQFAMALSGIVVVNVVNKCLFIYFFCLAPVSYLILEYLI